MTLEPTETKHINIKHLVVEAPNPSDIIPFDPKRDITQDQWKWIDETLEHYATAPIVAARFLADATLVAPEKVTPLMTTEVWDRLTRRSISDNFSKEEGMVFFEESRDLILYFPQRAREEITITDKTWTRFNEIFRELEGKSTDEMIHRLCMAENVRIIAPERSNEFQLTPYEWQQLEGVLLGDIQRSAWETFCSTAKKMKLLNPSKMNEFLARHKSIWPQLKQLLQTKYNNNIKRFFADGFVNIAATLTVLAADDIRITDDGVVLIPPAEKSSHWPNTPPPPVTRKF